MSCVPQVSARERTSPAWTQEIGTMKRLMSAAAAMLVLGSGAALAQPMGDDGPGARGYGHHERGSHGRGHGGRGMRGMMMLQAADLNGDNTVTRAEIEQLQTEELAFRDRNS
ncbi:unnamed protein product, partial [Chrysoparadoxa australica]